MLSKDRMIPWDLGLSHGKSVFPVHAIKVPILGKLSLVQILLGLLTPARSKGAIIQIEQCLLSVDFLSIL